MRSVASICAGVQKSTGIPSGVSFRDFGDVGGTGSRKPSASKPKHLAPKPLRIPESPGKSFPKPLPLG